MITDAWENFFLGQLGASAALAGLLFVSISINLGRIMSFPDLPNRALLAMLLLLAVLIVSSILLIPRQPAALAGLEVLAIGGFVTMVGTYVEWMAASSPRIRNRKTYAANVGLFAVAAVSYLVGAIILAFADGAGVYWIAAAIIFSLVKAVLDAWVLLVEINR